VIDLGVELVAFPGDEDVKERQLAISFRLEGKGDLGGVVGHPVKNGLNGTEGGIGKNKDVIDITKPVESEEFKKMRKNNYFQMLHY